MFEKENNLQFKADVHFFIVSYYYNNNNTF